MNCSDLNSEDILCSSQHSTSNVHELFENLTGKPCDEEEDDDDFGMNLDLSPRMRQSSSSYTTDTSRSTDSESVETMKRLLEELSQEDRSSMDELSELSRSSEESPILGKRLTKVPQIAKWYWIFLIHSCGFSICEILKVLYIFYLVVFFVYWQILQPVVTIFIYNKKFFYKVSCSF